jgi:DNA-binding transcriptional ArsR family regulator
MRVNNLTLYIESMSLSSPAKLFLLGVASIRLRNRLCQVSQKEWGKLLSRSRRTVCYAIKELKEKNLIKIVRRGKKLTNLYFLAHWLYKMLTGKETEVFIKRDTVYKEEDTEECRNILRDFLKRAGKT